MNILITGVAGFIGFSLANNLLKENDKITWKSGVEGIRNKLKAGNFNQVPQITCGKQMDLNSVVIKL